MSRTEPSCRWDGERGWLTVEHERDCSAIACGGCKPCPKTHCAMRGSCPSHVEAEAGLRTCPRCVGAVRRDLGLLGDLYAVAATVVTARTWDVGTLLEEVEVVGVESEALNLVGPAADPGQFAERRRRMAASYDDRGWCEWPRIEVMADDDPHHPYAVLGRWDMAMREQYGPQTDLFITVTSALDYLTGLLAGPFPHEDEFEDFAREIAGCRNHLEGVIHDSRAPESGRPCPRCAESAGKGPRLQKRYAEHLKLKQDERCQRDGCRTCAGRDDTWHCPDVPEHWWPEEDYRLRVASDYVQHAHALTADQLGERLGVKPGTIRVWANREQIRKRGRDHLGRQLYDVSDALRRVAKSEASPV